MKKKIAVVSICLALFAGVANASSLNGDYKGNPIVIVKSNGKALETDEVPAMIYDGHTVVPISLLRQLGASVIWYESSYSVNVQLPESNNSSSNNPSEDIKKIKEFSKAAEFYRKIMAVGDSISELGTSINSAADMISGKSNNSNTYVKLMEDQAKSTSDMLNNGIDLSDTTAVELSDAGINVDDAKTIFLGYAKTFKNYKDALQSVEDFYVSGSSSDYQNYVSSWEVGFEASKQPRLDSASKYFEWYNKLQNY